MARGNVRDRLAADADYDKIKKVLEQAMDMTRYERAFCPNCRKKVEVEFPDTRSQMQAVSLWLEQGFGRPGAGVAPVDHAGAAAARTIADIDDMTDEELALAVAALDEEEADEGSHEHAAGGERGLGDGGGAADEDVGGADGEGAEDPDA